MPRPPAPPPPPSPQVGDDERDDVRAARDEQSHGSEPAAPVRARPCVRASPSAPGRPLHACLLACLLQKHAFCLAAGWHHSESSVRRVHVDGRTERAAGA